MKFLYFFINNPVVTIIIFLGVLVFGLVAYFTIPLAEMPQVNVPVITVNVHYPGGSPYLMATAISNPIQDELAKIPGIRTILTRNTQGNSMIMCTFNEDKTTDEVAPDVQNALWGAQSNLPDLPNPPVYVKENPSNAPILFIQLRSKTFSKHQLYDTAYTLIARRLNMIEGVSNVDIMGNPAAAVVNLNPYKMASYNVGYRELANFLKNSSQPIAGGNIDYNLRTWAIYPESQLNTPEEYNNLIVKYQNDAPVRISDIGNADISTYNDYFYATYYEDGKYTAFMPVLIKIKAQEGKNIITVADSVLKELDKIKKELPKGMDLLVLYNRSPSIIAAVDTVKTTMYTAFILVCLVILLFLGRIKDMIIPAVVLPLTIIAGILIMNIKGFTLDSMSLMALTLAIGFCIDDAVVVLENTVRLIEKGLTPVKASMESVHEISGTVLTMTLALVIVFVPLIFMSGVVGLTFKEFALTVIITVLCSGIISLTLTPMMCARMLSPNENSIQKKNHIKRLTDYFMELMLNYYAISLKFVLNYKYIFIGIWAILVLSTFFLYIEVKKDFLPLGDSGMIVGEMFGPLDANNFEMRKFQEALNQILSKDTNIKRFVTITGQRPGADQAVGSFLSILKNQNERQPMMEVVKELKKAFKNISYPLGDLFVAPMRLLKISTGASLRAAGSQYCYVISGINLKQVDDVSFNMFKELQKCHFITDLQNSVKNDMLTIKVKFDRDKASSFGFNASDMEEPLYRAFGQGKLALYVQPLDVYDIIMQVSPEFDSSIESLKNIYLKSPSGKMVPLGTIANFETSLGYQTIQQSQQLYAATLSFNLNGNAPLGEAVNAINKVAKKFMPDTMTGQFLGDAYEFNKAIHSMGPLVIGAILLLYILLGILYKSFVHPITVLSTLPVAAFGGLLSLIIVGLPINLYGYVGMFMILGIIAKNGIMMVDFAKQNVKNGATAYDAILEASIVRFRPILMTGVAAIMGAIPIALGMGQGGGTRIVLGVIVVGGLIFSQIVTLFLTPPIYLFLEKIQGKYLDKFELTRSENSKARTKN